MNDDTKRYFVAGQMFCAKDIIAILTIDGNKSVILVSPGRACGPYSILLDHRDAAAIFDDLNPIKRQQTYKS